MMAISAGVSGSARGLPNSVMSAPAMKLRPAPMSTTASTAASASVASSASLIAERSAWLIALTGGLSIIPQDRHRPRRARSSPKPPCRTSAGFAGEESKRGGRLSKSRTASAPACCDCEVVFSSNSKCTRVKPERSYSLRSAVSTKRSAALSDLKAGIFFFIARDLPTVHVPGADRANVVPATASTSRYSAAATCASSSASAAASSMRSHQTKRITLRHPPRELSSRSRQGCGRAAARW